MLTDAAWDAAAGGSYKEALRYVNGMSIATTNALIATTADAALKKVCEWRRDTPGALADLMTEAGIVALDDSRAQACRRILGARGWTSLKALAAALDCAQEVARIAVHHTGQRVEVRQIGREGAEYRLVSDRQTAGIGDAR